MPITCTRRIQFCAGHRVMGHENKCAHLHGHNYVVHLTAQPDDSLDAVGRVVDFSVLKERIGGWIEAEWDHGFILYAKDRTAVDLISEFVTENGRQKLFRLPLNPTAENLAEYLLRTVAPLTLDRFGVTVTKVVVEETENCSAEACL